MSIRRTHLQQRVFSTEYITKTSPSSSKTFWFASKCFYVCIDKTPEKNISHFLYNACCGKLKIISARMSFNSIFNILLLFFLNGLQRCFKMFYYYHCCPLSFIFLFTCVCVSRMESLSAMFKTGLYINDLSMHDSSRDLVLAGTQQSEELKRALIQVHSALKCSCILYV